MAEMMDFRTGELVEVGEIVRQDENGDYFIAKTVCDLIEAAEVWKKTVDSAYKDYRAKLLEAMEETGIDKIDATAFVATLKNGYWKKGGLDTKALQSDHPKICEKYRKEGTWVDPTVSVRLRSAKK